MAVCVNTETCNMHTHNDMLRWDPVEPGVIDVFWFIYP